MLLLCYLFPPAALFAMGRPGSAIVAFFMWLWPFSSSVRFALMNLQDWRMANIEHPRVQHQQLPSPVEPEPKYLDMPEQSEGDDDPSVGMNGTQFRKR